MYIFLKFDKLGKWNDKLFNYKKLRAYKFRGTSVNKMHFQV